MMGVAMADEKGLVAEYRFETVVDDQTDDTSGKGNNARVHGAAQIRAGSGHGMLFDGNDRVDCGSAAALNLREAVTVECWVRPDAIPTGEVIVAGKGTGSYGLTYYTAGKCWWYCAGSGEAVNTDLSIGFWQHVAGTYDGRVSRLYVNGTRRESKPVPGSVLPGDAFVIGRGFRGGIAGVRVYSRALSAKEIAARAKKGEDALAVTVGAIAAGPTLDGPGYRVRVAGDGGLQVDVGRDRYNIETVFSHPGESIGWNRLGVREGPVEDAWRPTTKAEGGGITTTAAGAHYSLRRVVTTEGHRVVVADTITNVGGADVGVRYGVELTAPESFSYRRVAGADRAGVRITSQNPSLFVGQSDGRLGWLAEDDVLRLQLVIASTTNHARMTADRFALKPGKSYTLRWVLYPMGAKADYWTFVNQVRRDWDVSFTTYGPWGYFDLSREMDLFRDADKLKKFLTRKRIGVASMSPWVDYDNYNFQTGKPMTRAEYKPLFKEAMAAVKKFDPSIICVGNIEGNLVSLPPDAQKAIWDSAPDRPQNQYIFTPEQMKLLEEVDLRWRDCLLANTEGKYRYELYYRGDEGRRVPMIAIAVYAAAGNGQHKYWLDQAKFLLEECGAEGLYIDQFNMAFNDSQRYSYDKWDGTTVDMDPKSGAIVRRFTDAALVGIDARRDLADYVLGKGTYMLANTFPATARMQSVRMHRFNESEWHVDVFSWADGEKPPLIAYPAKGHFSTPIALGVRLYRYKEKGPANYARIIHKAAICYLRNGMLYYHYGTKIPETGPGAGEYGAINHMFPITPVELGPGFVVGEERVVACVSGTYRWRQERRPKIVVFDIEGRPVAANAEVTKTTGGWNVELTVKDWAEIAVIE